MDMLPSLVGSDKPCPAFAVGLGHEAPFWVADLFTPYEPIQFTSDVMQFALYRGFRHDHIPLLYGTRPTQLLAS